MESRGRFVWYDLVTTDPEGAIDFYGKVTGWGTQQWQAAPEAEAYTMWALGDTPLGGVMPLPAEAPAGGAPPHWVGYVAVPDVEATLARAEELGGKTTVPCQEIDNVGRFAALSDPQGAMLAVYTPAQEGPVDDVPKQGQFSWHELMTSDYAAAFDFYSDLFGWKKGDEMDMGEAGMYQMYGAGEATLGGMFNAPPNAPMPPAWVYYVMVPDIEAAVAAVTENGGQVIQGPMEVPGGDQIAQCSDPAGAVFALHMTAAK